MPSEPSEIDGAETLPPRLTLMPACLRTARTPKNDLGWKNGE